MGNIYICSTVYQLIVALQIELTLENTDSDIIITDEIPNGEHIAVKLKQADVFSDVFFIRGNGTTLSTGKSTYFHLIYKHEIKKYNEKVIYHIMGINKYKKIFFSNVGGLNLRLARFLSYNNKNAIINMFEDGIASYSRIYGDVFEISALTLRNRMIYSILDKVHCIYCFNPNVMLWKFGGEIVKIPTLDINIKQIRDILNHTFSIDLLKDKYNERVIFFEESYVGDGYKIDDLNIINIFEKKYGKDNMLIKSHPRKPTERFKALGYKTNIDKAIPWEAIALNIDLTNKVFVSVSSTAMVNTMFLVKSNAKFFFVCDNLKTDNKNLIKTVEVIKKIKDLYPEFVMEVDW